MNPGPPVFLFVLFSALRRRYPQRERWMNWKPIVPLSCLKSLVQAPLAFSCVNYSFIRKPFDHELCSLGFVWPGGGRTRAAVSWLAWMLCIWCRESMKSCLCNGSAKGNAGSKSGLLAFIPRSMDKCDTRPGSYFLSVIFECVFPVQFLFYPAIIWKIKWKLESFVGSPLFTPATLSPFIKTRLHSHILIIWVKRNAAWRHLHLAHLVLRLSFGSASLRGPEMRLGYFSVDLFCFCFCFFPPISG